jgi:endonuclease-3 related protein
MKNKLLGIYDKLYERFGPQHWWPAETPFEVAAGAILTQNTNWGNVEKAIKNLKKEGALNPQSLHAMSPAHLASVIKPAGYYNIKARRLKNFVDFLMGDYRGSMRKMRKEELTVMRGKLLSVNGIGPETADSIMLYALEKPVFVIDAYTKRFLSRHTIVDRDSAYDMCQGFFYSQLRKEVSLFNEYHALIVRLAKEYCGTKPLCGGCPLEGM